MGRASAISARQQQIAYFGEWGFRARPFVADPHGVHLFAGHAADPGFPSDHATAAFAIAVAIFLRKRAWGIFALVAATVLSVGRVALGVHYPSDVLAGAALWQRRRTCSLGSSAPHQDRPRRPDRWPLGPRRRTRRRHSRRFATVMRL
ncbi:MAG: phosphatase PAP2 family protein [Solirubrobacterales bacterium]